MSISVLMSGLPGRMAMAVAEEAYRANDMTLAGVALSAESGVCKVLDAQSISLLAPAQRDQFLETWKSSAKPIIVDYTHPSAVEGNVDFYTQHQMPFVLGTTGGDYSKLEKMVVERSCPAVIAPNMALPIVALTAMLEWSAQQFPGVFSGYDLKVKESHQKGKADTSGTAKDLIARFQRLGADFSLDQLHMCREPEIQRQEWGIPENHLKGHAFHTYDLHSEDRSAHFSLSHNILGRSIYAVGTIHAVRFLSHRVHAPVVKSYNMIDVLQNLKV
jgi:4-hydroxy-tetrahydrodipicolinate reductase